MQRTPGPVTQYISGPVPNHPGGVPASSSNNRKYEPARPVTTKEDI
jgi:hypothetical protein